MHRLVDATPDEAAPAPRQVQARGLFTLRLGLRRNDDEAPLRA